MNVMTMCNGFAPLRGIHAVPPSKQLPYSLPFLPLLFRLLRGAYDVFCKLPRNLCLLISCTFMLDRLRLSHCYCTGVIIFFADYLGSFSHSSFVELSFYVQKRRNNQTLYRLNSHKSWREQLEKKN
ncbi:hypothetical protein ECG_07118 [Echinococcus granulosus]|nr:hypothetical protein ECG_07118 [Echinococcus granulosus]